MPGFGKLLNSSVSVSLSVKPGKELPSQTGCNIWVNSWKALQIDLESKHQKKVMIITKIV